MKIVFLFVQHLCKSLSLSLSLFWCFYFLFFFFLKVVKNSRTRYHSKREIGCHFPLLSFGSIPKVS